MVKGGFIRPFSTTLRCHRGRTSCSRGLRMVILSLLVSWTGLVGRLFRLSPKGLPWLLWVKVFGLRSGQAGQGGTMVHGAGRTGFGRSWFLLGFIPLIPLIEDSCDEFHILFLCVTLPLMYLSSIWSEKIVAAHFHDEEAIFIPLGQSDSRSLKYRTTA